MEINYGQGTFREGDKFFEGRLILSEHKLFLKNGEEDLTQTYVPLEKIFKITQHADRLDVFVRPSLYFQYKTTFQGEKKAVQLLVSDLVRRRKFKKRFLKKEWFEDE